MIEGEKEWLERVKPGVFRQGVNRTVDVVCMLFHGDGTLILTAETRQALIDDAIEKKLYQSAAELESAANSGDVFIRDVIAATAYHSDPTARPSTAWLDDSPGALDRAALVIEREYERLRALAAQCNRDGCLRGAEEYMSTMRAIYPLIEAVRKA